jgi:hypothetical protein
MYQIAQCELIERKKKKRKKKEEERGEKDQVCDYVTIYENTQSRKGCVRRNLVLVFCTSRWNGNSQLSKNRLRNCIVTISHRVP